MKTKPFLLSLVLAVLALGPIVSMAGTVAVEPLDPKSISIVTEDTVDTSFVASLFSLYDQSAEGSLLDGWGAGIDLGYLFADNLSFHLAYAWTDNSIPGSIDRHTFLGYTKYAFGSGPVSPYVRLGGGLENLGDDYNGILGGGAGLDLYLTENITAYAGGEYLWAFDGVDTTRFMLGLRYHF